MNGSPWHDADLIVLGRGGDGRAVAVVLSRDEDSSGGISERGRRPLDSAELPSWVAAREAEAKRHGHPIRWVWSSTAEWYPLLLSAGVRIERCHDLRLCRVILHGAVPEALPASDLWEATEEAPPDGGLALFDLGTRRAEAIDESLAELLRQRNALQNGSSAPDSGRLRLLLAAESAGALVAAEMRSAGLPWDRDRHEELLRAELGERIAGGTPRRIADLADDVRRALGDPSASLDSQPKLLRALHRAGVDVASTSKWELSEKEHPVVRPLLEYKRLMRLYTANGWAWLDEWIHDGRFRPVYVPGGVVTGRWASSGGGALQLPRGLRDAVRADPGWTIVDADVAQLEPRVLAAMARDEGMAAAATAQDLYQGVVSSGVAADRGEAKYALLGALYGATTGDSARLLPRLRRAFPHAMRLVDLAAETGERGGHVRTWLGRTSPAPPSQWHERQTRASGPSATAADERAARASARDWGRFTRNFVVQGTAAEWALAWMADLRTRLADFTPAQQQAPRSGPAFSRRPHLALFLHDEVIVHAPAEHAEAVAQAIRDSAASAGRLLFGSFPIDFPLDVRIGPSAAS